MKKAPLAARHPEEVKSFLKRLELLLEEAEPALQWGWRKSELSKEAGFLLRQLDDIRKLV